MRSEKNVYFLMLGLWCSITIAIYPGLAEPLVSNWKTYESIPLGFKIQYVGEIVKCNYALICIRLPIEGAWVSITVESQPAVFLPGTYGGWYPYSETLKLLGDGENLISSGLALRRRVVYGTTPFVQDYWIIYGGTGAWDTVINCFTIINQIHYIISLNYPFVSGSPESLMDKENIIKNTLIQMTATDNPVIKIFEIILSSFTCLVSTKN